MPDAATSGTDLTAGALDILKTWSAAAAKDLFNGREAERAEAQRKAGTMVKSGFWAEFTTLQWFGVGVGVLGLLWIIFRRR